MKPITDKQKVAIYRMAKSAQTKIEGVENMSSFEASKVIEGLINLLQKKRGHNAKGSNYSSDALAGLAVKILAQRTKVDEILAKEDTFRATAAELYRVFSSARQQCLA